MSSFQIILLVVLIFFSSFFSGVETALMSISAVKTDALVKKGRKGAETLKELKSNPHKLIITILIGNNIVNIGAASLATVVFTDMFGSSGVGIATGVMTFLILLFGEITPKTYAAQNSEQISLLVARPIKFIVYILTPLAWIFELISKGISRLLGSRKEDALSEEELLSIVSLGRKEGILSVEAAEIMKNVLEFKGTHVSEIMTPEPDVLMVDARQKISTVVDFVIKSPYSRHPVYEGTRDNVVGILDIDDVLRCLNERKSSLLVRELCRKTIFVPETMEIAILLNNFEKSKGHMAIVLDEYGAVSGVVTLVDILEEIVGDIFDKSRKKFVKRLSEKVLQVDAKAPIAELEKHVDEDVDSPHYDTIAGFVQHKLQKIPKKGDRVKIGGVMVEVVQVTKKRIKKVKIYK